MEKTKELISSCYNTINGITTDINNAVDNENINLSNLYKMLADIFRVITKSRIFRIILNFKGVSKIIITKCLEEHCFGMSKIAKLFAETFRNRQEDMTVDAIYDFLKKYCIRVLIPEYLFIDKKIYTKNDPLRPNANTPISINGLLAIAQRQNKIISFEEYIRIMSLYYIKDDNGNIIPLEFTDESKVECKNTLNN